MRNGSLRPHFVTGDSLRSVMRIRERSMHKYLAIYFQVFAYEEPQMNADA